MLLIPASLENAIFIPSWVPRQMAGDENFAGMTKEGMTPSLVCAHALVGEGAERGLAILVFRSTKPNSNSGSCPRFRPRSLPSASHVSYIRRTAAWAEGPISCINHRNRDGLRDWISSLGAISGPRWTSIMRASATQTTRAL